MAGCVSVSFASSMSTVPFDLEFLNGRQPGRRSFVRSGKLVRYFQARIITQTHAPGLRLHLAPCYAPLFVVTGKNDFFTTSCLSADILSSGC